MGKPIETIKLKASYQIRIRYEGVKQNFEKGDVIEVKENESEYYILNGFVPEFVKETTEIEKIGDIEVKIKEQGEKAKKLAK